MTLFPYAKNFSFTFYIIISKYTYSPLFCFSPPLFVSFQFTRINHTHTQTQSTYKEPFFLTLLAKNSFFFLYFSFEKNHIIFFCNIPFSFPSLSLSLDHFFSVTSSPSFCYLFPLKKCRPNVFVILQFIKVIHDF